MVAGNLWCWTTVSMKRSTTVLVFRVFLQDTKCSILVKWLIMTRIQSEWVFLVIGRLVIMSIPILCQGLLGGGNGIRLLYRVCIIGLFWPQSWQLLAYMATVPVMLLHWYSWHNSLRVWSLPKCSASGLLWYWWSLLGIASLVCRFCFYKSKVCF